MLLHLHIENYALISHLDIDFQEGLSVLTGETGAGKSIIMGALSLILGSRADLKTITEGEQRCVIEAEFTQHIVRRELYANGKSRSFVDDSPVRLEELKSLSEQLIDIHSQHENLLIADSLFQLQVVDTIANNQPLLDHYSTIYIRYVELQHTLLNLQQQAKKAQEEADYLAFRYRQLCDAHLEKGELQSLEDEHYRLSHAEQLQEMLYKAFSALDSDEGGVLQLLHSCHVEQASHDLDQRLRSSEIELRDIAQELKNFIEQTELNPERLEEVEERLSMLHDLMRKYGVSSEDELIAECEHLSLLIGKHQMLDEEIIATQKALQQQETLLAAVAAELTASRQAVRTTICQQLDEDMLCLGVKHAKTDIQIVPLADYTENGKDDVEFLFAANLNQPLRRVSEVASGGEISRLMLCIKSLIACQRELPTIIFDEIDTGVSGAIASRMGQIMRQMAEHRQVLVITHLPQIAAHGNHHFHVYKADTNLRTETHIALLSDAERKQEIATMLSGDHPTNEALQTAQQLLETH